MGIRNLACDTCIDTATQETKKARNFSRNGRYSSENKRLHLFAIVVVHAESTRKYNYRIFTSNETPTILNMIICLPLA